MFVGAQLPVPDYERGPEIRRRIDNAFMYRTPSMPSTPTLHPHTLETSILHTL
jgi:hypothetical protein